MPNHALLLRNHYSNVAYHGELQRKAEMEQRRQLNENGNAENAVPKVAPIQHVTPAPIQHPAIGKIADYDPQVSTPQPVLKGKHGYFDLRSRRVINFKARTRCGRHKLSFSIRRWVVE